MHFLIFDNINPTVLRYCQQQKKKKKKKKEENKKEKKVTIHALPTNEVYSIKSSAYWSKLFEWTWYVVYKLPWNYSDRLIKTLLILVNYIIYKKSDRIVWTNLFRSCNIVLQIRFLIQ